MVLLFDAMLKSKQTILICDKSHAIIIAPFTDWLFCAQKSSELEQNVPKKGGDEQGSGDLYEIGKKLGNAPEEPNRDSITNCPSQKERRLIAFRKSS